MDKLLLTPEKRKSVINSLMNFGFGMVAVAAAHFVGVDTANVYALPVAFAAVVYVRELLGL